MSAARGRRRRARPRRRRTSRSSAPTTRRCCAGASRSRRCASTAACRSCSTGTCAGFRFSIGALALPAAEGVEELVELVTGAAPPDHVLRLYRTDQRLVATAASLPDGLEELRARGVALRSVDVGAPAPLLAGAKTTSYGEAFAARRLAERDGADEALLVAGGLVLEAATANIWWRRGDELCTPATRPGVLPGVTRELVLELERRHGRRRSRWPTWPRPTRRSRRRRSAR